MNLLHIANSNDSRDREPAPTPGPVGVYGVDDPGHQDGEDDVAVKVAPFRDGAGDNRGAGGSKCTLNKTQS